MVDISTVSIVIASAGVFAAAIYYVLQIRHQTKMRQTDLVMRLYSIFGNEEFQKRCHKIMADMETMDYNSFVKKYDTMAPEAGFFFEGVGVLLHRKLIDISLVDDLFSGFIKRFWERAKPIVEDARKQLNYPQYGEWFEYLYNEMKKREQRGVRDG